MIIDQTGFNLDWWSRFTSVQEFVEAGIREHVFEGENQVEKLRAAYELISVQSKVTGVRSDGGST